MLVPETSEDESDEEEEPAVLPKPPAKTSFSKKNLSPHKKNLTPSELPEAQEAEIFGKKIGTVRYHHNLLFKIINKIVRKV